MVDTGSTTIHVLKLREVTMKKIPPSTMDFSVEYDDSVVIKETYSIKKGNTCDCAV
jgi:hypothetical protein